MQQYFHLFGITAGNLCTGDWEDYKAHPPSIPSYKEKLWFIAPFETENCYICCLAFPAAPMIPMTCFVYFFVHVLLFAVFRAPYRVFFLRFLVHHIVLFPAILRAPKIRTNVTEHSKITNHIYNVVTLYASFLPEWVGGQQKTPSRKSWAEIAASSLIQCRLSRLMWPYAGTAGTSATLLLWVRNTASDWWFQTCYFHVLFSLKNI